MTATHLLSDSNAEEREAGKRAGRGVSLCRTLNSDPADPPTAGGPRPRSSSAKPATATLAGADLLTETCGVVPVTVLQCQRDVVVLVRVHGNHECFSNACGFDE
jgi:hypothetical protein